MRNRRSVAGQNLRREIFDIRRAAGFSSTVSLSGRFGASIARQPNLWPGIQVSGGTIDLQSAETHAVDPLESCQRDPDLICREHKRIAGHIESRQDFLLWRSSVKRSPENRAFQRLAGVCQRHFGPLSLEIRIVSRKFKVQLKI